VGVDDISFTRVFLTSIVPSIVSGATVALVTVPIALGRFRAERLWERRLQAYADLLVALSHVRRYLREALSEIEEAKTLSPEASAALADKASQGREEIRRAAALGSLILDAKGAARLEQLEAALDEPYHNMDLHEEFESALAVTNAAYTDIRTIARASIQGLRLRRLRGGG
jgi:hypothetical protein